MIIHHPLLGPRDADEFVYLGDASLMFRPESNNPDSLDKFYDYTYLRDNPSSSHRELWYHEHGDRSWLVITRNTTTHEIIAVALASEISTKGL